MSSPELFQGEDYLLSRCADSDDIQAKATVFRQSGLWEEVVPGMTDLTIKYDPLAMSDAEAEQQFRKLWVAPSLAEIGAPEPLMLDASFADGDAPDRQVVAERLGVEVESLPRWISERSYRVAMMGFQPGFAYLQDIDTADAPTLARLDVPRQRVAAGSIGFLGGRACVYALDGPGGWPIIGCVLEPLFRRDDPQPFLLQPGQIVRFRQL